MSSSADGTLGRSRPDGRRIEEVAGEMAEQICRGFRFHDRRERERAVEAFAAVDRRQFAHLDPTTARAAAAAYVDALWAKDAVESSCTVDGDLDYDALAEADWGSVRAAFAKRAALVGMDARYAEASTLAWKRHKVGGDYARPMQRAQGYELRAAMDDPEYPRKPHQGQSGFGPEAARYLLAVELHDMHTESHWEEARAVMTPYYERILRAHDGRPEPTPGSD
ncbi:hypothetical protein BRC93_11995 [Halobacteriales archaeon QS_5_70_15]|nr:MAG: hypothetical protein BRC93_11995 [Halobacteriales archaeon QS_5_70_15]